MNRLISIRSFCQTFAALPAVLILGTYVSVSQAQLTHRYSFTTDASDSVGSANGTLNGPATVSGGKLQLNNPNFTPGGWLPPDPNGYLSLPASILPSSGSVTIEQWFNFTGSGFFTEGWAFSDNADDANPPGANNGQYLMHAISAPQGGPNAAGGQAGGDHIAQATTGYAGPPSETDAFETSPGFGAVGGGYLDDGESFMSATVIDGTAGTLSFYLYRLSDGAGGLQQTIPAVPLSSYAFTNAFLGRSPFPADNATSGTIDEFRIYSSASSAAQIAADEAAGPDVVVTVPEPSALSLTAIGMLGFTALIRRRRDS